MRSKIISSSFLVSILLLSAISYPASNSPTNFIDAFAETFDLEMEGGDNVTLETSLPDELDALTIAAWVTPEFSIDADKVMTIISQYKGFVLGINSSLDPEQHAIFAVYDGMEWNQVTSYSKITEELTHLAATFEDGTIKIYVNGEYQGSLSNIDTMELNQRGVFEEVPLTSLSSGYEINVGSYNKIKRNNLQVTQEFSGIIHQVELFGSALDTSLIKNMYLASFDIQDFSQAAEITPSSVEIEVPEETTNDISSDIEEFDDAVVLISSGTTSTSTQSPNDGSEIDDFQNADVILSNGTTEETYSNGHTTSNEEILQNLLKITIKYTELYGDGSA